MEHNAFTLWFTGLSGSGKSTLSWMVYMEIKRRGLKAELLDGDIIRKNFSKGLGFSRQDREINVRRIGFISYLLTKNGIISVVAAIAPYAEIRTANRQLIGNYVEVYCSCPIEVIEKRDPKGLYKKARAGLIKNFTGISDPYEEPKDPEIIVRTDIETPDESYKKIINYLDSHGYLPEPGSSYPNDYSEDDEQRIRERLKRLGYL